MLFIAERGVTTPLFIFLNHRGFLLKLNHFTQKAQKILHFISEYEILYIHLQPIH